VIPCHDGNPVSPLAPHNVCGMIARLLGRQTDALILSADNTVLQCRRP
jgi:hypothetical protein